MAELKIEEPQPQEEKKEEQKEAQPPQATPTEVHTRESISPPSPEPTRVISPPPPAKLYIGSHDEFWREFNDSLEPAHEPLEVFQGSASGVAAPIVSPVSDKEASAQDSQVQDQGSFVAKYWVWILLGTLGLAGLAFLVTYVKRRHERDDDRENEPPPPPPEPPKPTGGIDTYLPYGK